jgi:Ser/Thr protein kinase RdoA (MazF antagonist)
MKPKFSKLKSEKEIQKSFPKAKIISYNRFKEGLVNPTYKINIKNPKKTVVIKLYKIENLKNIKKTIEIFDYLSKRKFPVPKIYSNNIFENQGIVVLEHFRGENALELYNKSPNKIKQKLLENSGKLLRRLHKIKIPEFWIHNKHEVKSEKEWIKWTQLRVKKYLKFAKENLDKKYYDFLKEEFQDFLRLLKKDVNFVPLHWDYHLSNMITTKKGEVVGLLDFDNAMKGHSFADIGQSKYFIRFWSKDYENFDYFLKGYGVKNKEQEKLIHGYFLLHLVAVTRNIWGKKKYNWIFKKHHKMLDEVMKLK